MCATSTPARPCASMSGMPPIRVDRTASRRPSPQHRHGAASPWVGRQNRSACCCKSSDLGSEGFRRCTVTPARAGTSAGVTKSRSTSWPNCSPSACSRSSPPFLRSARPRTAPAANTLAARRRAIVAQVDAWVVLHDTGLGSAVLHGFARPRRRGEHSAARRKARRSRTQLGSISVGA